jgi:hypothetical protein
MSRTDNTMPSRLQTEDGRNWWHVGGVFRGIKEQNRRWHRAKRAAVRRKLRQGFEPEPTRTRSATKWDMY